MNKTVHFLDHSFCKNSTLDDSRFDSGIASVVNSSSETSDATRLSALSSINGTARNILGMFLI